MGRNAVNRKLTNDQVLEVRTQYMNGALQKEIGARFGIGQTTVSQIIAGCSYKNAPWPPTSVSGYDRRSLPKFPGYEFDDQGNAYSFKYNRRYGRQMRLWPDDDKGYLMVPLSTPESKQYLVRVNRIICTLFHGPPPTSSHQARHLNGTITDNRAINLAWGTQRQNESDKDRYGTRHRGECMSNSKLTESIVKEIRASLDSTRTLAKKYGVSQPAVYKVRKRKTWKHVR